MFVRIVFYFVFKLVTRAAAASRGRIAALDHEVGDHAMKNGAVVKFFAREKNEIVHRFRRVVGKEIAHDFTACGLERGGVLLVGINRHRGRRGVVFGHNGGKYEVRSRTYEVRIKNGARGPRNIEGKVTRVAVSEPGGERMEPRGRERDRSEGREADMRGST